MKKKLSESATKRNALYADMQKMLEDAKGANRNLTDDEIRSYDQKEAEFDVLESQVQREERLEKRAKYLETETSTGDYNAGGEQEEEERSGKPGSKKGDGAETRNKGFASLGEMLVSVCRADRSRQRDVDERLIEVRSPAGMNENVPSEGGWLVQKEHSNTLLERSFQASLLYADCLHVPIGPGKNGITFNRLKDDSRATGSRFGGIRVYWTAEGETKLRSKIYLEEMAMKLKKLAATFPVTDELLEDAVGLEGMITALFPKEFAFVIDESIMYGSGVGQMLGYMNSGAVIEVAKEISQPAKTITFNNVLAMLAVFHENPGSKPMWIANRNTMPALATMTLATGTSSGVPVFMPAGGASGKPFATLFGIPIVFSELASTLGTRGDLQLVDLSEFIIIEKGDIKKDVSMHVLFESDQSMLRFVKRIDGQPAVNKPITPYKGASGEVHSPYVILQARS